MSVASGPSVWNGASSHSSFFQPHILDDLVHWDMAQPLDHHLCAMGFGDLGELAQGAQLGELRASLASAIDPGRSPSPSEKVTSRGENIAEPSLVYKNTR